MTRFVSFLHKALTLRFKVPV